MSDEKPRLRVRSSDGTLCTFLGNYVAETDMSGTLNVYEDSEDKKLVGQFPRYVAWQYISPTKEKE